MCLQRVCTDTMSCLHTYKWSCRCDTSQHESAAQHALISLQQRRKCHQFLLVLLQDQDLRLVNWNTASGFASLNRSNLLWHIIISQRSRRKQTQQQQQQTDYHRQAAHAVTVAWDQLFGAELGPLPEELYVNGGGQFVVRRERVLAHSRSFYQDCLTWLDDSIELSPWDKGMVFEYTWKSIFGEAAAVLDQNIWS